MEELAAIWRWSAGAPHPWGQFVQLLMLTGARRNEWASAEVSWLDIDAGRLEIPAAHYKTGKVQVLPLSMQAKAILRSIPAPEFGPYLFSTCSGVHPISGFSKIKRQLDVSIRWKGEPLAQWTLHDLRRSMATHMERIGVQPHVIEVCLGHALRGIGAVYRRYEYLPEKALALQQWADELSSVAHEPARPMDRPASS
jgi:integrase